MHRSESIRTKRLLRPAPIAPSSRWPCAPGYSLKVAVFHDPDANISGVRSVSSFAISSAYFSPLLILKEKIF